VHSAVTIDLFEKESFSPIHASGLWQGNYARFLNITDKVKEIGRAFSISWSTLTTTEDPWFKDQQLRDAVITVREETNQLRIDDLGWSRDETLETLMRLRSFEEDWEAPGMEDYDEL